MSEHSKLLEDVRALAYKIAHADLSRIYCVRDSAMVRALANAVERQDAIIAETVAACQASDVAITEVFDSCRYPESGYWINLRTARYKSNKAITNAGETPTTELEDQKAEQAKTRTYRESMRRLAEQPIDSVKAELRAACKTCDEVITRTLAAIEIGFVEPRSRVANELYAAGHLAGLAAKLGEPKRDIDESLSVATKVYDALLRKLADDISTNQVEQPAPPEPTSAPRLDDAIDELAAESNQHNASASNLRTAVQNVVRAHRYAPSPSVTDDDRVKMQELWRSLINVRGMWHSDLYKEVLRADEIKPRLEALRRVAESEPVESAEIEMRTKLLALNEDCWTWECRIGDTWIEPAEIPSDARIAAHTWLAALSKHLGIPLVGVWKDGE